MSTNLSRRTLLGSVAGTAVVGAVAIPPAVSSTTKPASGYARQVPIAAPVTVPATLVGMHAHRWPGGTSPAPTYQFGTARSHDHNPDETGGVKWNSIQRDSADQFNWVHLDRWVDTHYNAGRKLIYTLYGTPRWCAAYQYEDPYGEPGGDSPPTNVAYVERFVSALVQRYNGAGVRRLQMVELWNEPMFPSDPEQGKFWRGTAQQLAEVGAAAYTAAKAADPGITVLWPGFVEWADGPVVWQSQVEYGNAPARGKTGKDWADAQAFHWYDFNNDLNVLLDNLESAKLTREALGRTDWVQHNTELGIGDGIGATLPKEDIAVRIQRWLMLSAAHGNQSVSLYSHDGNNLGKPAESPVISAAIDLSHTNLVGKQITEAGILNDGRVSVTFAGGSSWTV